ncbi:MAG: hypothetical protein ACYS0G_10115 [Planctomycetota bacterium]|jgi:hypothetical protein
MGLLAVELNDAGIRAARASADGLLPVDGERRSSPGFARVQGGRLVTGLAAARQACVHPLEVDGRFWDRLDTEPLDPKDPRSPNRAEVACAHLQQVLEGLRQPQESVVLAVPPVYDERQLGILVGIARELKLPLEGLVASPVALELDRDLSGPVMVVDLALHRCVLSVVEAGERVVLVRTRVCPDVGLHDFRRQWIKAVGDEFVRSTRFDPRHDADTEQRLHDRLPEVLDALATSGSFSLSLEAGSLFHRVTVTDQLLAHSGHGFIVRLCSDIQEVVASGRLTAILLAHEAAQVPGLERMLRQQVAAPVRELDAGAAALGLLSSWPDRFDQSSAPAVAYHTRRDTTETPAVAAWREETPARPTHLLLQERAHALGRERLFIDLDQQTGRLRVGGASGMACLRLNGRGVVLEVRRGPVRVNGEEVEGELPVGLGAQITVGGCSETIKLIALTR